MRQRAIQAGAISNPYRFVEAGEEFDHTEPLKWAIPIGSLEPGASTEVIDAPRKKSKAAKSLPPADDAAGDANEVI